MNDSADAHFDSWYHERESAWLYRALAQGEPNPTHAQLFRTLADAAEQQAGHWAARLPKPAAFHPRLRARIVARLIAHFGGRRLRPMLAAMKLRGLSVYSASQAPDGHAMPVTLQDVGQRHRSVGGGNLRAAVFGVNDGLVSNASLILGVAGAGAAPEFILMSGLAGLLAGALSMASGEYVSVRSQREMYEYQIGLERAELAEYPEEEAEELKLIYEARGIESQKAHDVAHALMASPEHALDTLAREELGLNPDDLGSPWGAAIASFLAFGCGALIPLVPCLVHLPPAWALRGTALLSVLALFGIGMILSLYTGRSALRGGLRMALIGCAAAGATFLAGRLFGVALG